MIFFDANVVIEAMLVRHNSPAAIASIKRSMNEAAISALTAHQIVYFGKKEGLNIESIRMYIQDFKILPLTQQDFDWSYLYALDQDFEDALQLAVAIRGGCTQFVTLDKKLYQNYKNLPQIKVKLIG